MKYIKEIVVGEIKLRDIFEVDNIEDVLQLKEAIERTEKSVKNTGSHHIKHGELNCKCSSEPTVKSTFNISCKEGASLEKIKEILKSNLNISGELHIFEGYTEGNIQDKKLEVCVELLGDNFIIDTINEPIENIIKRMRTPNDFIQIGNSIIKLESIVSIYPYKSKSL